VVKNHLATIDINKLSSFTVSKLVSSGTTFGLLGNTGMHALHGNIWEQAMQVAVRGKMAYVQFPTYKEMLQDLLQGHKLVHGNTPFSLKFAFEMVHECTTAELLHAGEQAKLARLQNNPVFGSVAFGLLGNKGMHSMHGNTSKPGLPFPMPDEPWEIAVKAITGQLNYDIEESMWENPKLHQALAWSLADSVGWNIPKGEIIEQIILARLHKTKFLGDPLSYEYKYANWERSAYYILDGITSVLEDNKVKDVIGNPYLHGIPKDKLVRPPASPKKLLFKANRLLSHKSFAVKVCLQQKKHKHITEISCCLELISLKPFNHYKWWANGRLSGLKRQLPYMGNHKASQHVPSRVVNSEEYKVPTCTVQSPKIFKVQQAALVALVLKWNSCNYRTCNPFTIKGNNNICGGDIYCCPSPHCCKAQMIPLTNRDGQVSCLDRLGSIPCPTQSSANWSAC
jgi:hypothetical protein